MGLLGGDSSISRGVNFLAIDRRCIQERQAYENSSLLADFGFVFCYYIIGCGTVKESKLSLESLSQLSSSW